MRIYNRITEQAQARIPKDWLQIQTVDMHTGGEPLRVIISGYPPLEGNNILEYRRYCKKHLDYLRQALMFEPRGHADMYGCLIVPPNDPKADFGVIFMHNEGYSTMCGHAVIALSTLVAEQGWMDIEEGMNTLRIDAPCGRIESHIQVEKGKVVDVNFHGVPSFVIALDQEVDVPGIGRVVYDLAYGGAFYAYVDLDKNKLELDLHAHSTDKLIDHGRRIKQAVIEHGIGFHHPFEADLSFLYGTIFIGPPISEIADSRNVCIFADGEVDRSPTGSGVSGRMAIHHARNEIEAGDVLTIESITGSLFTGSVVNVQTYGPFTAVIPEVSGTAHMTGIHTFIIDPRDPFKDGFLLR
ncbi:proline racemase family protein [Aureitalea marina]|uniref:Proline racemase n=1 Tax=Aureitalea marina TaxID=930804 RepID=A0A2S7KLN4_9FLAO|nr:proline racemase family protein [Aureitalea marina]PQB03483.1 proline racemase [Aureitalea marina]